MKRQISIIFGLVLALTFAVVDLSAQRGQGQTHGNPPANAGQGKPKDKPGKPTTTPPPQAGDHGQPDTSAHGKPTVAALVTRNTGLASRLQSLLPGTNLEAASSGFTNLGHFVSAAHVSHNLGIPFDQLKAKVTGPNAESLGVAIKDLKPSADANAEAKKAEKNANADIKASRKSKTTS